MSSGLNFSSFVAYSLFLKVAINNSDKICHVTFAFFYGGACKTFLSITICLCNKKTYLSVFAKLYVGPFGKFLGWQGLFIWGGISCLAGIALLSLIPASIWNSLSFHFVFIPASGTSLLAEIPSRRKTTKNASTVRSIPVSWDILPHMNRP